MNKTKKQRLKHAITALHTIIDVCNDILGGMSDSQACRKHNISLSRFENLMSSPITGFIGNRPKILMPYSISPEERIYCDIMHLTPTVDNELYIPYDIADTLNIISPPTENQSVYLYYYKGWSYSQIADKLTIPENSVRNNINRYLRNARTPDNLYLIKYGKEHYDTMMERRAEYTKSVRANNNINLDADLSLIPIDTLDFDAKTLNTLHKCGIHTINDLLTISILDIEGKTRLGNKTSTQLVEKIAELSVRIKNKN